MPSSACLISCARPTNVDNSTTIPGGDQRYIAQYTIIVNGTHPEALLALLSSGELSEVLPSQWFGPGFGFGIKAPHAPGRRFHFLPQDSLHLNEKVPRGESMIMKWVNIPLNIPRGLLIWCNAPRALLVLSSESLGQNQERYSIR